ncbi:MAG: tRNA preQ1(34) S-adenosylmethionine ribosyltransferase-isomerase QueA [Pseudomonadota bacterium]
MLLSDFDYVLPDDRIALRPASPRDTSKLLHFEADQIGDHIFADLADFLRPNDHLVLNNTKVIPGRLFGIRKRDTQHGSGVAQIELTLLKRLTDGSWEALAKPAKRLAEGDIIEIGPHKIRVCHRDGAEVRIEAQSEGALDFRTLNDIGQMPLPPYIAKQRPTDDQDLSDYQTVFAEEEGAVAAPTASLHFTDAVFDRLKSKGIEHSYVTLHVGAGTFLPVTDEDISSHKMHGEWYDMPASTAARLNQVWAEGGRVIPVGTTALRVVETAAKSYHEMQASTGETDIFITPGYRFKATDGLITNFHLPKSTLLMLVSALVGHAEMHRIYDHAIQNAYRFFSYGDSSLIFPPR